MPLLECYFPLVVQTAYKMTGHVTKSFSALHKTERREDRYSTFQRRSGSLIPRIDWKKTFYEKLNNIGTYYDIKCIQQVNTRMMNKYFHESVMEKAMLQVEFKSNFKCRHEKVLFCDYYFFKDGLVKLHFQLAFLVVSCVYI